MVTVNKLKLDGFGRFLDREFNLSPGLNVVFGGNEAGKSTIHSFIEAMLFGFWKPNVSNIEAEPGLEKYRPWQGSRYGGELDYTWQGGRVKVIRNFAENTVILQDPATGGVIDNLPLNGWGEPDYGRLHFGCSKLVFRNTISISQLGSATDTAVAQEVRNLLSNLAQSGGSGISVKQGLEALREARRQTDFELMKARAVMEQLSARLDAGKEQIREAAKLEIGQYQSTKDLEKLNRQRRELKERAVRLQGQMAYNKLERLEGLRRRKTAIQTQISQLSEKAIEPRTYEEWTDLMAEIEKARELNKLHTEALNDIAQRSRGLEVQIQELTPYQGFDKDTLIEMSSAWQMQVKGQQVMEEMQSQLDALAMEIREVTTELSKLPYFRPDTLEQAAALQTLARGGAVQNSQDELTRELEKQERKLNLFRNLPWLLFIALAAVGAAAWFFQPLIGIVGLPLLWGMFSASSSSKKANLRCRNLRRELYTLEMEFLNSQRQREQAQRELEGLLVRSGTDSMRELEERYRNFVKLSDRNRDLLREQKYIAEKLESYVRESSGKSQELTAILEQVGLGTMTMEQALACFRVNLDKLLDAKMYLEQCREQEGAARLRMEQSRQELASLEEQAEVMMRSFSVNDSAQVDSLAEAYTRRQELEQESVTLEQRIQDILDGTSEDLLREQAASASIQEEEYEDAGNLTQQLEALDQQILSLQSQKSEGLGRLEGIYTDLPSPADLQEELWQVEERCKALELEGQALDLAVKTITELADELNSHLAPELNLMVSSLVQRITGGKYNELQVANDMSINVLAPEQDSQVDLSLLSGGTIDQFYFACRVAIADLVTGGGLPLLLDDSFVQYDDQRLRHMLKLLVELGSSRQIILLTCQQRELDELAKLAPGRYRAINLDVQ